MRFDILTLFPEMFQGPLTESILKRAQASGLIQIELHNIRDYAIDRHRTTDDAPYGGGAGMVMKVAPLAAAIRAVSQRPQQAGIGEGESADSGKLSGSVSVTPRPLVVLLSPGGEPFNQQLAEELAGCSWLMLVCGHYEGVDERVREALVDRELTIGDYVLTGGELAAMVVADAVARLVPGVLDSASTVEESYGDGLLEYPHYTRPATWEGRSVPPVLLSGHHGEVAKWRRQQRLRRTSERRPDLLAQALLSDEDRRYLEHLEL